MQTGYLMRALTCFHAKMPTTITHTLARDRPNSRLASLDPEAGTGSEQGSQARKASHWLITSADRPFCRQSERADTTMPCQSEPRPQRQCDRRQDPLKSGQTDQSGSIYAP